MNFVIYEKATGRIIEQRSAGNCYTEAAVFAAAYGPGATFMQGLSGAIPTLDPVTQDGSVMVDLPTLRIIPNPAYVPPPPPPPASVPPSVI